MMSDGRDFEELPYWAVKACRHKSWDLGWSARGVYLHLETSELIEALRGKRGDVLDEAADVLLVWASIIGSEGLRPETVLEAVYQKLDGLLASIPPAGGVS